MLISNVVTYLKEVQRGRNLKFEISQRAPKGTNHRDYSTIQYNRTSSRIHAQHDRALADRRKLVEVLVWVLLIFVLSVSYKSTRAHRQSKRLPLTHPFERRSRLQRKESLYTLIAKKQTDSKLDNSIV